MSAFDATAPSFDRHRALPEGVPEAIRTAILRSVGAPARPLLLDIGAGTGRIGRPFVAAGDAYVGIDLSYGMLREFRQRADQCGVAPRLAQADGERLPFRDATFDAVMLIQIFGGLRGWRGVLDETRRVLRPASALILGRSIAPKDGIDHRMKQQLASLLAEMGIRPDKANMREDVGHWLDAAAHGSTRVEAAAWNAARTPRGFLDRHRTGARFAALPTPVKGEAMRKLAVWAAERFGSLDTEFSERHRFELQIFKLRPGVENQCPN
jgi:ubiquinone/menaquinone biosynthesis C-methylase UbiE